MRDRYLLEHPAALLPNRTPQLRDIFHTDMQRIARLVTGWRPSYHDDFRIMHSCGGLLDWFAEIPPGTRLALDLETDANGVVDMVGLASSPARACLIALPDPELLTTCFDAATGHELIVHYGEGIEVPWLLGCFGDKIPFVIHDLHKLFHALDPEYASAGRSKADHESGGGSGALAFIQSLFSWRPYHKHLLHVATKTGDHALKAHYCMLDCVVTWECFHRIEQRIMAQAPESWAAYLRDALPLLPIMVQMTREGWAADASLFKQRKEELQTLVKAQAEALIVEYGDEIRPKGKKAKTLVSMHGVKAALKARGIKLPMKRREGKAEATETLDREARESLLLRYPELTSLEAYWASQDRLSDWYKDRIIDRDGRVHPHWSGYEKSWRWRCTHPNVVQWPEEDRDIFVADPGCLLVQFDTSAGEYRWFAGESGDPALLAVFKHYDESKDPAWHPHVVNTGLLFSVDRTEAVQWKQTKDPRLKARYTFSKNYIYRLIYSYLGGVDKLRATAAKAGLKFSRRDIEAMDTKWFAAYPVAKAYRERQASASYRTRYVCCREWGYGRRIHLQDKHKIMNVGLNHVEQAGIAGIVNQTVRETESQWGLLPRANTHDGLVYNMAEHICEAPREEVIRWIWKTLTRPLTTLGGLIIPVDVAVGPRWGSSMTPLDLSTLLP